MNGAVLQLSFFLTMAPVAAVVSLTMVVVLARAWGRSYSPLIVLYACVAGSLGFNTIELLQTDPLWRHVASVLTYSAVALGPVAWFWNAQGFRHSRGTSWRVPRTGLVVTLVIPVLTIVFVATDPVLHLVWTESHVYYVGNYVIGVVDQYGPWFWVHAVYSYGMYTVGSLWLLGRVWNLSEEGKSLAPVLLVAVGLPLLSNAAYLLRVLPGLPKDITALALFVSACLFTWAFWRIRRSEGSSQTC